MIIQNHQLAIKKMDIVLVSDDAIREHKRYQFKSKNKTEDIDDVANSSDMTTGAPTGENDDLVMCGAYTTHAASQIIHFIRPKRAYAPGTFGEVMGLAKTFDMKKKAKDPYAIR